MEQLKQLGLSLLLWQPPEALRELGLSLLLWLPLAVPGLVYLVWGWLHRRSWRNLLPPKRTWAVPWSGWELLGVVVLYFLWEAVVYQLLVLGLGQPEEADVILYSLLANALAAPLQLATMIFLPVTVSGTRPYQLGLTPHRLGRNALTGYLGFVVLSPFVWGLDCVALLICKYGTGTTPTPHQVVQLVQSHELPAGLWVVLFLTTVVLAPLREELLFRGVLLFWLPTRPHASAAILAAACTLAYGSTERQGLGILLFFLSLLPIFTLLPLLLRLPSGPAADRERGVEKARAVYASAAIFAVLHPWPTPIPLFVLGLGLGWLAQRTRSLAGPVVLHALFNLVAFVELLLKALKLS